MKRGFRSLKMGILVLVLSGLSSTLGPLGQEQQQPPKTCQVDPTLKENKPKEGQFKNIQDAIDASDVTTGSCLIVEVEGKPEPYQENLKINGKKSLQLRVFRPGIDIVTIQGDGSQPTISIFGNSEDITIGQLNTEQRKPDELDQRPLGFIITAKAPVKGGQSGIFIQKSSKVSIIQNHIKGNHTGILLSEVEKDSVTISNNAITNNQGCGVNVDNEEVLTIESGGNRIANLGGILCKGNNPTPIPKKIDLFRIFNGLPMIRISKDVYSDFPTIQAAIDAAVEGDTIEIAKGTYKDELNSGQGNLSIISKGLTLGCEKKDPNASCILEAKTLRKQQDNQSVPAPVIDISGSLSQPVKIEGVWIKGSGDAAQEAPGIRIIAVIHNIKDEEQKTISLINSLITGKSTGIEITNSNGIKIDLSNLTMSSNESYGVSITGFRGAPVTITATEGVKIFENKQAGIILENLTQAEFKASSTGSLTIRGNAGGGIVLKDSAIATFEGGVIVEENKKPDGTFVDGISISDQAEATIQPLVTDQATISMAIIKNRHGILIKGSANAKITESTIQNNIDSGIQVEDSANVSILKNFIQGDNNRDNNKSIGILLKSSSAGKLVVDIQDNTIVDNGRWGVAAFIKDCLLEAPSSQFNFDGIKGKRNKFQVIKQGMVLGGNNGSNLRLEELIGGDTDGSVCPTRLQFLKKQ